MLSDQSTEKGSEYSEAVILGYFHPIYMFSLSLLPLNTFLDTSEFT